MEPLEGRMFLSVSPGLVVTQHDGFVDVFGTPGPDKIALKLKSGLIYRIWAGAGDDTVKLTGKKATTVIYLGPGNDVARLGPGNDRVYGEDGDDVIRDPYNTGHNRIFGGFGNDVITTKCSWNFIDGGECNDRITTGNRPDTIIGGGGSDTIKSGQGDDIVDAGDFWNRNVINDGEWDYVDAGTGKDTVIAGNTADGVWDQVRRAERVYKTHVDRIPGALRLAFAC